MNDGFHLNVAIVTNRAAWNSTPDKPRFDVTHFCAVYAGRDKEEAMRVAAEFAARFPQGDKPGMFQLSMREWKARGYDVEMPGASE